LKTTSFGLDVVIEYWLRLKPAMPISSKRYLLPFDEVAKYLGFAKSVADSKGFTDIKPKYLTTAEASGIPKRYRLEEIPPWRDLL
jgi:hypothetical protein